MNFSSLAPKRFRWNDPNLGFQSQDRVWVKPFRWNGIFPVLSLSLSKRLPTQQSNFEICPDSSAKFFDCFSLYPLMFICSEATVFFIGLISSRVLGDRLMALSNN